MSEIYNSVIEHLTSPGQMFEVKDVKDSNGVVYKEYVSFPDNLKAFYDTGLLHPQDRDWLVHEDERFSYKEVYDKAAQTANALISFGIKKGDRVAICMQNNPEFIYAYMAITGIGAICVPLNSWWVPSEVAYGIKQSGAKLLIADSKRLKGLDGLNELKKIITSYSHDESYEKFDDFIKDHSTQWPDISISRNDPATIYYTSGSTGLPKGVLSSHKGILSTMFSWLCFAVAVNEVTNRTNKKPTVSEGAQTGMLLCVPLFHVTGSHSAFLMSIPVGRKIVMLNKWDPGEALRLIDEEKITDITGVPTQTWELLNHPDKDKYDTSSLVSLGGGGGPRPPEHVKKLDEEFEGRPGVGYGLSETNALGTLLNGDEYQAYPASCGRVVPPLTEIKILDDDWNEVEAGSIGEVVIKSPANMIGYWDNIEATKEVVNDDGWFRSGDLGYFDGPFLHLVDRKKELVIRGGENISCIEVEGAIYEHNDILEACVFGKPDERLGEIPCAAIHLRQDSELTETSLQEFLSERLAPFKIPAIVKFYEASLPKVGSGKFDKLTLKKDF